MTAYYRPIPLADAVRLPGALRLAGGWCRFAQVEVLSRRRSPQVIAVADLPSDVRDLLTAPRPPVAGLAMDRPQIMGILNVTQDSFSDGGLFDGAAAAVAQGLAMHAAGADLIDVGGESTRPGAALIPDAEETARTQPVVQALAARGVAVSIDTRKAAVAQAALDAGAVLVNDVSAMTWDADMARVVADSGAAICLMHAQGDPATMQSDPRYDDVVLDVYDHLSARIDAALAAGIARDRIVVDPGIGFGKTQAHNLALLRRLSLFHALGCPVLLGASRKRFIGTITDTPLAADRVAGSLAVTLAGVAQGVQIHRVHDTHHTVAALAMMQALGGEHDD
ncbi:Dihydropteroate synthase [Loktanella fryxellensis]|uniref:Dihydropteroate synthase n=1 Tax=Loktanella fryxellensis TaxID=245187 RepID=A0A1H8GFW2_9RHOB|nr:dihydropteroate synthase [Loktanella fryxellensis]SEN42680.1 Dihydropteroate synthase [Loktanella fryxellensis]